MQLHENLDLFEDINVKVATASSEDVTNTKKIYSDFAAYFSNVIPFLSDPEFKLIDYMDMKHGDVAYRGYGILDEDGNLVYSKIDDYWGDNIEETVQEIKEKLK
ncbi:hypothetical protein CIB95_01325 [Lottiidibacillus patelloidae]|uniref:Alkyl hydroperoxide reductase subunit C/ Thiol specific antioxidant domain-containing protein n=1 Tax=Lottiidibacillus patelloidae TaxID=2670334 RepID=A0A263BXE6_9BACI|nr:hypothetical protein CIB95_01325 [Lottiidibacillus patelloidae]